MKYSPSRSRRSWPVIAAAVVAMLAAAGTGLAWVGYGHARPVPASPRPALPGGRTASEFTPITASRSPGPARTALADLAGLRWADFYGVELPVSQAAGPWHQRAGLAWGFADTPLGALLAAMNIGVRANAQWGPGIFAPTIRRQVTGPAAAALLAGCQSAYQSERLAAGVRPGEPLGRAYVTEEAFRWVAYSPADATVDIVSAGPGTQGATVRAVTQIEVTWSDGDWRVIAPLGGDWGYSAAPLASLHGYTVFPIPHP